MIYFNNKIKTNSFMHGIAHSYAVCIALALIFITIGMLGHAKGFSLTKMLVMSATVFAGPLQAIIINNYELPILILALNAFILNFKFLLMSSRLLPTWPKHKMTIPSLHFICSSTYMVCATEKDVENPWLFYLGIGIPSYIVTILSTAVGFFLWQIGTDYQEFLNALAHIILPVHFTALTMKRKKEVIAIAITITGFLLTAVLSKLINPQFTIIAWIIIAGIVVFIKEIICGKQSVSQVS